MRNLAQSLAKRRWPVWMHWKVSLAIYPYLTFQCMILLLAWHNMFFLSFFLSFFDFILFIWDVHKDYVITSNMTLTYSAVDCAYHVCSHSVHRYHSCHSHLLSAAGRLLWLPWRCYQAKYLAIHLLDSVVSAWAGALAMKLLDPIGLKSGIRNITNNYLIICHISVLQKIMLAYQLSIYKCNSLAA